MVYQFKQLKLFCTVYLGFENNMLKLIKYAKSTREVLCAE